MTRWCSIRKESVPKIILSNTINLFFLNCNQHFANSNHNSFRVLFNKIASLYFIWKIYLYFSIGNVQQGEAALFQLYRYTFDSFPIETTEWIKLVCAEALYRHVFLVSPKIRVLPPVTLSQTRNQADIPASLWHRATSTVASVVNLCLVHST